MVPFEQKCLGEYLVLGMQNTDVPVCLHETGLDTRVDRRTTIVRIESGWLLVEYDEQLSSLANTGGYVDGLKVPTDIITIAHVGHMSPRELGFEVISSPQNPNNPEESASSSAPGPGPSSNTDPAAQQPQREAAPSDVPVLPVEPVEQWAVGDDMEVEAAELGEHQVEHKGKVLSESDTLATLREACTECGIGKSGGKKLVLARLKKHLHQMALVPEGSEPVVPPEVESRKSRRTYPC